MSKSPLGVLVVEDNEADVRMIQYELRKAGFEPRVTRVQTESEYLAHLVPPPDIILCDYNLPQFDALRALELRRENGVEIPFIIVSGSIGEELAVQAVQSGASDYLLKDRLGRLGMAVRQAIAQRVLREAERKAKAAEQESIERLILTLDCMLEGCQILDFEFRYLYLNAAAARHARRIQQDLLGQRITDVFADFATTEVFATIQRCMLQRLPFKMECEFEFPDGTKGTFDLSIQPVPEGVLILSMETTEQKQAEQALQASEARYRILAESLPQLVWMTDSKGTIEYLNSRCYEYTGLSFVDLPSWTWLDVIHPDDLQETTKRWTASLQSGADLEVEYRIRRTDGTYRWHMVRGVPLRDERGGVTRWFGTCTDMHDQKLAEAQFLQSQKMEAVGQLAGGVAHDFNNILMVISGYSEWLIEQMPADDPHRDAILAIQNAGVRAAGLTRQLLAFSRKQILEPKLIDVNDLVSRSESLIRRLIREDIIVTVRLTPALRQVRADPVQFDQVLLNLVVNARDAMPDGGRLTIETSSLEVPAHRDSSDIELQPGHYVRLKVSDTGCGMTEEVRSRMFEPFFTTKEVGRGTGLGLAVVHGIVKQSGGQIRARSELGIGTTFEILIPAVINQHSPQTASDGPQGEFRGSETVLLVEDEPAVRAIARHILESRGYQVLEAHHGNSAIEVATRHAKPIDLLLTDIIMPEMGGRQLAEVMRSRQPNLRVLFMSGYTDDVQVLHRIHEATDSLIQKPFTPKMLARRVREILDTTP